MYYPSFFAGVRPFETLRERVDNPLDLSVKQTVSRSEGSCPTEQEDLQLLMERKLAVAAGLPSQQMPLLDNMFAYKPFGTESMSCQMRRSDILPQNLNPSFCTTTPSGHPINHLGLVPDILHQNRDALTMEGAAPPLTSFAMNASGIPYHMRIGSAVMANQRAYYGHSSVLPPHMSAPFNASLPHIPLYTDLMSGLTRRPVEPDSSVFGALSSLRGPPDPSTQFSDHLQRLRGQHIQQSKCSAPCCMPSTLHTSGANHSNNGCSCCDVGLAMPSNVSTLILPPSHAIAAPSVPVSVSVSCNDVSNRDMIPSNSNPNTISHCLKNKKISDKNNGNHIFGDNSFLIKSQSFKQKDIELKSQSCSERHTSLKTDIECDSSVGQNSHLSNPLHYNKSVFQSIDCFNNETDKCLPISNSTDPQKDIFCLNISNKLKNNSQEVITLDEEMSESETENISHKHITIDSRHKYETKTKFQLSDNQMQPKICSTGRTQHYENTYDSFNPNDVNKHRLELCDQNSSQNLNQNNVISTDLKVDNNPTNFNKLETNSKILEQNNDCPNINLSNTKLKHQLNKTKVLYFDQKSIESNPELGSTRLETNIKESECTANIQNCIPEERPKTNNESAVSVKSVTKQLKDYKPVTKHMNITAIDKSKRQAKETKTVEVQCDGPDWTPIVLPQQLKNKLHKVVRNKRLFGNNSIQLINYKKDSKKRKTCKQKHFHRKQSRSRSRSSSVSSNWSRKSSPERHSNDGNSSSKAKKRSMLQCLSNSEGYVADKIKKTDLQPNLIASDPSQLGREERALQRAIKHIEDLNKPYTRDNSVKYNAKNLEITENNQINLINITDKSADSNDECILSMKKISETYQKIIESVVYESRVQNEFLEETNKKTKDLDSNGNSGNSDRKEPVIKSSSKKKPKLKQKIIEKLLDDDKQGIEKNVSFKTKKKRVEQNNEKCDNEVTKTDANPSQQTVVNKQKKGIVSVRRRRFRSGLDMIRNAHRRKKSRNQIQASISKQESNRCQSLETSKENIQKLSCDPTNGSVPTETKRLMVNKALGETLLHRAARSNRLDVVNSCLQSSTCDVNARDNANYTPLHECSTRGNLQIARILLQNGADVNASAAGGIRPLHDAIENNHIEVVRLLLSYGADPNISTYSGSTAMELSRSKAMLTFLKGFLDDISSDCQTESKKDVLSWKFNGSSNILDTNQTGFDVLDGLSSDEVEEESHDFLFEVSDSPMDPTYRLPNLRSKGSDHFMLLSDVLNRTRLTKDEFHKTHSDIEILTITKHELEAATIEQILTKCKSVFNKNDSFAEDIVLLDDKIRNILGIETLKLISIE